MPVADIDALDPIDNALRCIDEQLGYLVRAGVPVSPSHLRSARSMVRAAQLASELLEDAVREAYLRPIIDKFNRLLEMHADVPLPAWVSLKPVTLRPRRRPPIFPVLTSAA